MGQRPSWPNEIQKNKHGSIHSFYQSSLTEMHGLYLPKSMSKPNQNKLEPYLLTYLVYAGMGSFSIGFWLLMWRPAIGWLVVVRPCQFPIDGRPVVWIPRVNSFVCLLKRLAILLFLFCLLFARRCSAKLWSHMALVFSLFHFFRVN